MAEVDSPTADPEEVLTRATSQDVQALIDAVATVHRDTFKTLDKAARRERLDLDVRGLLAIISIIGGFALAFFQLLRGMTAEIPSWSAAIIAGVAGFYFGSRGGSDSYPGNGHRSH